MVLLLLNLGLCFENWFENLDEKFKFAQFFLCFLHFSCCPIYPHRRTIYTTFACYLVICVFSCGFSISKSTYVHFNGHNIRLCVSSRH